MNSEIERQTTRAARVAIKEAQRGYHADFKGVFDALKTDFPDIEKLLSGDNIRAQISESCWVHAEIG